MNADKRGLDNTGLALHFFERLGNEGSDLVILLTAVCISLIKIEIRQRDTAQRRVVVVAGVESDGAVRDVDAVTSESSSQRKQWRGRVSKHARLAAVVLVKIHVAHPQQRHRRALTRMLTLVEPCVHVNSKLILVIKRQLLHEREMLRRK